MNTQADDIFSDNIQIKGDIDITKSIMGAYPLQSKRAENFNELLSLVYKWLGYDIRVWSTLSHTCRAISSDSDLYKERIMKRVANVTFIAFFNAECNPDKALEELIASGFLPTPD